MSMKLKSTNITLNFASQFMINRPYCQDVPEVEYSSYFASTGINCEKSFHGTLVHNQTGEVILHHIWDSLKPPEYGIYYRKHLQQFQNKSMNVVFNMGAHFIRVFYSLEYKIM